MATIEFDVECDVCGSKLDARQYGITLCVNPCEKCLAAEKLKGQEEAATDGDD